MEKEDIKRLEMTLQGYLDLQDQISELQRQQDELKRILRIAVEQSGKDVLVINGYKLSVQNCNRTCFNTVAFEAEPPGLAKKYTSKTNYNRFRIYKKGDK